jgi:predicted nucleic-acid-binding protein
VASLDTSCLLRWLVGDVPAQRDQMDALLASGAKFEVADAALIEAVFALERFYKLTRSTVAAAIRQIVALGPVRMDRQIWAAILAVYEDRPKLSITDIYLAHKAGEGPLYTFDRKLAAQTATATLVP